MCGGPAVVSRLSDVVVVATPPAEVRKNMEPLGWMCGRRAVRGARVPLRPLGGCRASVASRSNRRASTRVRMPRRSSSVPGWIPKCSRAKWAAASWARSSAPASREDRHSDGDAGRLRRRRRACCARPTCRRPGCCLRCPNSWSLTTVAVSSGRWAWRSMGSTRCCGRRWWPRGSRELGSRERSGGGLARSRPGPWYSARCISSPPRPSDTFPRFGFAPIAAGAGGRTGARVRGVQGCLPRFRGGDAPNDPGEYLSACPSPVPVHRQLGSKPDRPGAPRARGRRAGSRSRAPEPRRPLRVNPGAVEALAEAGIEWRGRAPRSVDGLDRQPWDLVVTVCDDARESCPIFPAGPVVAHWGMPDPAAVRGRRGSPRCVRADTPGPHTADSRPGGAAGGDAQPLRPRVGGPRYRRGPLARPPSLPGPGQAR